MKNPVQSLEDNFTKIITEIDKTKKEIKTINNLFINNIKSEQKKESK